MLQVKTFSGFHDGMYGLDIEAINEWLKSVPCPKAVYKSEGMLVITHDPEDTARERIGVVELQGRTGFVWGGSGDIPQADEAEKVLNDWLQKNQGASILTVLGHKSSLYVFYSEPR